MYKQTLNYLASSDPHSEIYTESGALRDYEGPIGFQLASGMLGDYWVPAAGYVWTPRQQT